MAGILGKLWDDVAGGSPPDKGLKQLRKSTSGNAGQFPDELQTYSFPTFFDIFQPTRYVPWDYSHLVLPGYLVSRHAERVPLTPAMDTCVPSDARRIMERRFSTGAYDSPGGSPTSPSIAITKPQGVGLSSIDDSPSGTPSSLGSTPPASPSTYAREKDNIWRSVFHPGQNKVMRKIGSDKFDKAQANSPTVYDWLYSADTKSEYR